MTNIFTVSTNGKEVALSEGYDAELQDIAHGGHYSKSFAFGYCQDICKYCDVDNFYTLGSDSKFARALDLINQWVEFECFEEAKKTHNDDGSETLNHRAAREVWKRYNNVIIEDRDLDGAAPEAVRQKFEVWIESRDVSSHVKPSRYRFCLLIDEDVLENLDRFPTPPTRDLLAKWQLYSLKVIDIEIDGEKDDRFPRGYKCCVMTPPWMLAHIYFFCHNLESDEIRNHYRGIPIYEMADY